MSDIFSNQATPKYLGYVYQVLIALEECLDSKPNQTIWIECNGDVYDGKNGIETKHHLSDKNLTDNDPDFWNTLKNWCKEDTSKFDKFILHTTSNISKDSLLDNWNLLNSKEKYEKISRHNPAKGIEDDYSFVMSKDNQEKLCNVLASFFIKSSQKAVEEKVKELEGHSAFAMLADKNKADAIDWAYGHINRQAIKSINDKYRWSVKRNSFFNDFCSICRPWISNQIPFENTPENEIDSTQRSFPFIKELTNIGMRQNTIELAITDYLRAEKSRWKHLQNAPSKMTSVLDEYDESILNQQRRSKNQYSYKINVNDIGTESSNDVSRLCYFSTESDVQNSNIPEVTDTQKYYPIGRMHHNVNEGDFIWKFTEDDFK